MTALLLVGTSHRRAPVELRERLALGTGAAGELAARLAASDGEAAVLSTCNRTEVYLVSERPDEARDRALAELASLSGLERAELEDALYTEAGEAACLHLCRVAAGLDSMIRGEGQILGQVRDAHEAAQEAGALGPVLHGLFRHALRAGKRVRTETAVAETPTSVSAAAGELVERVFGELDGKRILLLGAGKMGELTALDLVGRGAVEVTVANRSPERAERLAQRFRGSWVPLERVEEDLERTDIVVASTSSAGFVLTAAQVARACAGRRGRPLFFVDIAVPRDLDPGIAELGGCYLYDIDDLERVVAASSAGRLEEAARAEAIACAEADAFRSWQLSRDVVPAIASLRALAESIRRAELARAEGRLGSLSPSERRAVESLTAQIVAKLLHQPTVRLKEAAAGVNGPADGVLYAEAVRHLFGLREDGRKP